jgi:hypothetical protein
METRNPYLDAQQAKGEAIKALKMLKSNNESVEQVSRKQIYLVKNKRKAPYYILITSAPSNLKLSAAIKGTVKEYGKYPLYVFFTRDVNTYPKCADTYWAAVKRLYKQRGFAGAIMGLDSYTSEVAKAMNAGIKVKMDYKQFVSMVDTKPNILSILKEIGLKGKKAELAAELIELIKQ